RRCGALARRRQFPQVTSPREGLTMTVLKMTDLDLAGKRVLIREDLNVPVKDGVVKSDARILASLPTIRLALEKGAAVMVCSHLGRPTEGEFSEDNSLAPENSPSVGRDRKSTRLNSSHVKISYAVFCLKKKKKREKASCTQTKFARAPQKPTHWIATT